jgi:hypothetical protein
LSFVRRSADTISAIRTSLKGLLVRFFLVLGGAISALLLTACSDNDGGGELTVTLDEWSIAVDKESLPEGPIELTIKNEGEREHDLVIVRTDIAPDELPTETDGSVDLGAPDVEEVHSIEDIEDGDETGRTYDLDPGNYVFIDNRVEDVDGEEVAYYEQGMRAAFEVTEEADQ